MYKLSRRIPLKNLGTFMSAKPLHTILYLLNFLNHVNVLLILKVNCKTLKIKIIKKVHILKSMKIFNSHTSSIIPLFIH
jgi:hypothetical protein